jgi:glycosyltransferase involved in cell wall biosynthesis
VTYYVAEPQRELPFPSQCRFVFADKHYPNAIGRVAWLSRVAIEADATIATFHATAFALHWNRTATGRRLYYAQAYEPEFYSDSFAHLLKRWPMMLAAGASYLLPLEKVVNCEGSRKGLTWRDRAHAPEMPPGIDLALYRPKKRDCQPLTIGHISRREEWKGSDYFFRAMKVLREQGRDCRVRVAYDLWPETHGVAYESVQPKTEAELAEFYGGLDILVSTVCQKGFGYPPLEAMACGALCISTPMDFGRPWIDHIPIIANSTRSIVEAIRRCDQVDRDAYIRAGLETAAAFDWNLVGDRWNTLLQNGAG